MIGVMPPHDGRRGNPPDGQPVDVPRDLTPVLDAVEARLLGQPRTMRRREVSAAASVSLLSARRFWQALGFSTVQDEDVKFTDADLVALRSMVALVRGGVFDEATALSMTRAFARTTDRLAVWQTQLMAEALAGEDESGGAADREGFDEATALAAAVELAEIADELEPLLVYAWRRHLAAAIGRLVADAEPQGVLGPPAERSGVMRSVGFADLVSFTQIVRRSSERDLARLVQRFEALASDVVTAHAGRVIKMVGDEMMFVTVGAPPAAAIAMDLVEAIAQDELLPDVRVGLAYGPVLLRLGDVFGTTVNRASRLTGMAPPGGVFVDEALASALHGEAGFGVTPGRPRALRGIGRTVPWTLRREVGLQVSPRDDLY